MIYINYISNSIEITNKKKEEKLPNYGKVTFTISRVQNEHLPSTKCRYIFWESLPLFLCPLLFFACHSQMHTHTGTVECLQVHLINSGIWKKSNHHVGCLKPEILFSPNLRKDWIFLQLNNCPCLWSLSTLPLYLLHAPYMSSSWWSQITDDQAS